MLPRASGVGELTHGRDRQGFLVLRASGSAVPHKPGYPGKHHSKLKTPRLFYCMETAKACVAIVLQCHPTIPGALVLALLLTDFHLAPLHQKLPANCCTPSQCNFISMEPTAFSSQLSPALSNSSAKCPPSSMLPAGLMWCEYSKEHDFGRSTQNLLLELVNLKEAGRD